jgi:hypothetical protein
MLDGMSLLRIRRSWPVATAAVLAVTVVLTVLQFLFPQVRLALWRDRRRPEHDLGRLSREASSQGGGGHGPEHGGDRAEWVANILVDLGYALLGPRMRPA